MAILTLPATPRYRTARFGPQPNTLTHVSALDGSAQTLEFPGTRWAAEFALPAMHGAEAEAWAAKLTELGGEAGRFYAGDPYRIAPRGPATTIAAHQNDIPNNTMVGAVVGTLGAGGALPTGWSKVSGVGNPDFDVVGFAKEDGIDYIDIRAYNPASAGSTRIVFSDITEIAAVFNDPRAFSCYVVRAAGSTTNISALELRHDFYNSVPTLLGTNLLSILGGLTTGNLDANRKVFLDTVDEASTAFVRTSLWIGFDTPTTPDITFRIGLPQDEPETAATAPIRTSGTARSRPAGPFVEGTGQTGKAPVTGGWTPDTTGILLAGDYVAADLPSGGRSLHKLTADADSDVSGEATLTVAPPLRESPADAEPVLIAPATCVMKLIDDGQARWSVDEAGFYTIAFAAIESFNVG